MEILEKLYIFALLKILAFYFLMSKYYIYSLSLDKCIFGLFYSPLPLLNRHINHLDKETWGRFNIHQIKIAEISFLQSRRLNEISAQICSTMGINLPKNYYIIPAISDDYNFDTAKNETNFLIKFLSIVKNESFDPLYIYAYPEHPNTHSPEAYKQSYALRQLSESAPKLTPDQSKEILNLCNQYLDISKTNIPDNSIFPYLELNGEELASPALSLIKFISYFRSFLNALNNILPLLSAFELEQEYFPDLIECFSLEFIPSFVRNHNFSERIGDAVLEVVITNSMVNSLAGKKNYFVNKQIRVAVSNKLFGTIGHYYNFENCFIGPYDVEKLPGDCFESVAGKLYKIYGFEKVVSFWKKSLFVIPLESAQQMDIVKAIEVMKIDFQSNSLDLTPDDSLSKDIQRLIGSELIPPPSASKGELQTKCKLIGASILKLAITEQVVARLHEEEECLLIPTICSKNSIDSVAKKLNVGDSKQLRVLCGGIMLQNGFQKTMEFAILKLIPHFNIINEMRSGRSHSHIPSRK